MATGVGCGVQPGTYDLTITGVESDCAEAPPAEFAWRAELYETDRDPSSLGFFEPKDACPFTGAAQDCAMDGVDAVAPLTDAGFDAVGSVDWTLEAAWTDPSTVRGTLLRSAACVGGDCERLADLTPEPCTTTWSWEGAQRDGAAACRGVVEAEGARVGVGSAPWDPIYVDPSIAPDAAPVVLGGGERVETTPVVVPGVLDGTEGYFRPASPLLAGAWSLAGASLGRPAAPLVKESACVHPAEPRWGLVEAWTVEPFGQDPTFDAARLAGTRWDLLPGRVAGGAAPLSALVGMVALHLEIEAVDAGIATFRLLSTDVQTGSECILLVDEGDLSPTGELTWSRDRIDVETEPDPTVLYAPSFRLGFAADGERAAGGEAFTTVDARGIFAANDIDCSFLDGMGGACVPCADDGVDACVTAAGFAWTAARVEEPIVEDLAWCGADLTAEVPEWHLDCGSAPTCAGAGIGVVGLAAALRRRRAYSRA